ncbi:hypothetical protein DFH28DRAFT_918912 [Melampsora americana]|nr:hypothetical protein DFH28DRAFT_918912 [Melampsora americana]
MVTQTLIHAYYEYANPASPFLPEPTLGGRVGLLCPRCSSPMTYKRANEDSWLMGCPIKGTNHIWKTWRCDQLNHELALINAGRPRPIVSEPSDWGPRVSPGGKVLPPRPAVAPKQARYQPFTHRGAAVGNSNPTNGKTVLPCKRIYKGTLSQNHKKVANKECPHQYCLGCCHAYGTGICRKHTLRAPNATPSQTNDHGLTPQQVTDFGLTDHQLLSTSVPRNTFGGPTQLNTSSSTSVLCVSTQPSTTPRRQPPAMRPQPHKWAQAADTLGRRLTSDTIAIIQKNRAERDRAAARHASAPLDKNKLATILLWVNPVTPQTITAYFPRWPIADLEQSDLLMQAIHNVDPQWNRALSVWDNALHSWRDTMVNYPHRCPEDNRTILLRLMTVEVPLTALPQLPNPLPALPPLPNKAPSFFKSCEQLASEFLSKRQLPPICNGSSPSFTPDRSRQALITDASGSGDSGDRVKSVDHQNQIEDDYPAHTNSPEPSPTPTPIHIDLTTTNSPIGSQHSTILTGVNAFYDPPLEAAKPFTIETVETQTLKPSSPPLPVLKKGWPLNSIPISSLLAWYIETMDGNVKKKWQARWGAEWKLVPSTMYRYRLWVFTAGYDNMCERFLNAPEATVGDACLVFQDAFNTVAGVGQTGTEESLDQ